MIVKYFLLMVIMFPAYMYVQLLHAVNYMIIVNTEPRHGNESLDCIYWEPAAGNFIVFVISFNFPCSELAYVW